MAYNMTKAFKSHHKVAKTAKNCVKFLSVISFSEKIFGKSELIKLIKEK